MRSSGSGSAHILAEHGVNVAHPREVAVACEVESAVRLGVGAEGEETGARVDLIPSHAGDPVPGEICAGAMESAQCPLRFRRRMRSRCCRKSVKSAMVDDASAEP